MLHFRKIIRSRRFTLFWGLQCSFAWGMEGWFRRTLSKRRTGTRSEIWDFQWTMTLGCQLILMQFGNGAVFTSFCCRCLPPSRIRKHQGQKPRYCAGQPISHSSPWSLWTPQTELMLQIPCWPFSPWTIEITKSHVMKESHMHLYSSLSLDATQTQNNEFHHVKAPREDPWN